MKKPDIAQIDAFIEANEENIKRDIARIVAHNSVEAAAAPGAPFGPGVQAALEETLAIAKEHGFATRQLDGYMGWAELPGAEEGHIATITHLDIVPVGEGWDADPLTLREKDGWLIGRGVSDDKGPGILCLYAAKFIRDSGLPLRYGLRLLFGTNEESGMIDVDYYIEKEGEPLFCFSPDSAFPVCNGEKGSFDGDLVSGPLAGNLVEFEGGIASNVVPQKAHCVVRASAAALTGTDRITVSDAGEGLVRLEATGASAHASTPENGVNSIGLLVDYLLENGLCAEGEKPFLLLLQRLHSATDGSGVGIACADDLLGPLTCIGGMVSLRDGLLTQNINIRYPKAITGRQMAERFEALCAECGGHYAPGKDAAPFYIDADSAAIASLLAAYEDATGEKGHPFTIGGGTYARHFKNAVSYGAQFPGIRYPAFAGAEHGPNEGAKWDDFKKALKIYILAIAGLQEVDF